MLKTVIIGAGPISHKHARALHALGVGIAGVLDLNQARAQELAGQYGSRAIRTLDEVVSNIDMVHIFTPPAYRVEYVRQAVAAGKHIYIEKPMAISIADAREIVALAAESRGKLMVGFNNRFRNGYRMLQKAVQDGRLGEIIGAFAHRLSDTGLGGPAKNGWRTDPSNICGISIESLSHDIDMLLHLVDGVLSVSANTYGTAPDLPTYDNNSSVTFRLRNGGTGVIQVSLTSYLGYGARGVFGTKGAAMIVGDHQFDFTNFVIKTADMQERQIFDVDDHRYFKDVCGKEQIGHPPQQSYLEINRHFKECIEEDRTPLTSAEDGLRALIFSQAILESNQTGKAVAVDL
jgi:predicted dehydrogenase